MPKIIEKKELGSFKYILKHFEGDNKYVIIAWKKSSSVTRGITLEVFSNEENALSRFNEIEQCVYWCGHCGSVINDGFEIKSGSETVLENQLCPNCGSNKYLIGKRL